MLAHGDLVCPDCQVLLPAGATVCVKCGKRGRPKTGHLILDLVGRVHPWLVQHLGTVGGTLVAGFMFVVLMALTLGAFFWLKWALASP